MMDLIQRRQALKAKFNKCEPVFLGWTSFFHPSIVEIFAKTGLDAVGLDIEHSTMSQEQAQRLMSAGQGWGTLCLPRIATHNLEMIKRLLDSGADGIIAPLVNTAEQAQQLLSWMRYPPQGIRSFGVARAQGYGFDYAEYTKTWNESFVFIAQIESKEGVSNIESILAVPGVDGVMIGPFDISGSLGIPGQLDHPLVKEACQKVIKACLKFKKPCGTQIVDPDANNLKQAFVDGYKFVVMSSDLFALWKWGERMKVLIKD